MSRKRLLELEVQRSPGDSLPCRSEDTVVLEHTPSGGNLRKRRPPTTSEVTSARPSTSRSKKPRPKKARNALQFSLCDDDIDNFLMDSDSEDDFEKPGDAAEQEEDEEENGNFNFQAARDIARRFRDAIIMHEQGCVESVQDDGVQNDRVESPSTGQGNANIDNCSWSEDFSTFSGQKEAYLRSPGPLLETHDPVDIFMYVWDERIMKEIVTNRYAWQVIAAFTETDRDIPKYLNAWEETTVHEMYRYFAMLILMAMCYRSKVNEYFATGILEMKKFRNIMPRNRFQMISRFLHFQNNELEDPTLAPYDRKIRKIRPILDHTNNKFAELYVPNKHLSLDESLLLWKGRLNWVQCIRTKAARFGIKSFELCEAESGYQLRCLLYAGKDSTMCEGPVNGFQNSTAKVVLELMDGFLDVGHTLVMDNWYNQLSLTRYLKTQRKTDVIGTINPRQINIPDDIKNAKDTHMARGQQISRHCGDVSIVAWKDVKLVTVVSTYHTDIPVVCRRAGVAIQKPACIAEYNKYMGGVDSKDQKLSTYLMERKRSKKWYMKVFKRLLNTSLLNTYIVHTKNPITMRRATHRNFRYEVALGLLRRFPRRDCPTRIVSRQHVDVVPTQRLMPGNHFADHTPLFPGTNKHRPLRCVRCTAAGRRSMVTIKCILCNVLCV